MARVLRQNRVGLAIIAVVAVVLVIYLLVRGCGSEPQVQPPETSDGIVGVPVVQAPPATPISAPTSTPTPAPTPVPSSEPTESIPPTLQPKSVYERWYEAGREAFDSGDYINARNQLSQALKGLRNPFRLQAKMQLATIANRLTFGRQVFPGDTTAELYHVKQGETPAGVVKGFGITADLFMKINNISNARSMIAGRSYKVIKGPFNVVVHKKTFELEVFLGDYFIKRYAIGLGKDDSSPVGEFLAGERLEKPPWFGGQDSKTGRKTIIYYGDPDYPLGDHWITLRELSADGSSTRTNYGIHGTKEPESIGTQASRGCIRMLNEDVAELFDLLVSGKSRITILAD